MLLELVDMKGLSGHGTLRIEDLQPGLWARDCEIGSVNMSRDCGRFAVVKDGVLDLREMVPEYSAVEQLVSAR